MLRELEDAKLIEVDRRDISDSRRKASVGLYRIVLASARDDCRPRKMGEQTVRPSCLAGLMRQDVLHGSLQVSIAILSGRIGDIGIWSEGPLPPSRTFLLSTATAPLA